ncbi:hypothetical protein, partial [Mycobacterium avium]|uniref:hypothetical protein n=1 Tax=Mycobacterium avium TaxID=1764 RepID=UPI000A8E6E34
MISACVVARVDGVVGAGLFVPAAESAQAAAAVTTAGATQAAAGRRGVAPAEPAQATAGRR